ncbi:VWA domain-containing protein [Aquisphaera insulae]|uniref:VWA domain-containing protein n=1 Tax=Aquisphaera insulae TaxID=2712864 RepID=UPI0013EABCFA|nr:VWA domain-containing protein [Aquisphaera insulae]
MNRIWQLLLGLEPRSPGDVPSGESTHLELTALPGGGLALLIIAAAVAAFALLWWLPRREKRELSGPRRAWLAALRALVLLAAGIMLVEPVLVTSHRETVRSQLPIIVDDSESMRFSDPYTDETRAAATAAALKIEGEGGKSPVDRLRETPRLDLAKKAISAHLDDLGKGRDVSFFDLESASKAVTAGPARAKPLEEIQPRRSISPLGDALRGVLAVHRGRPVAGIALVSDGRSNAGEDPLRVAESLARLNVPIFPIASGGEEGPRNVRVVEVVASPVVFATDPMTLSVIVEARGLKEADADLVLEQRVNGADWQQVASQRIPLGDDGIQKRTSFRIVPKVIGQYEYRARVEDAGPELTRDDNVATAMVRVVRQQIRVLMIAGSPSPEMQFLRNALQRDQHVAFAAWLQHADPGYRQPGDKPISRLPGDAEELARYDALILIDPDMQALGPAWPELIANFVGKDGGGLIYMPGELYSQQLFDAESGGTTESGRWTRILPVVREPGLFRTEAEVRLATQSTYALELTPEGRGDPIFEFHPDPIRNRTILTSLPGMYWSFPVTRARPGATVLARHGDPRMQNQYGRHVLLASQLYGPGRTVFIGFDSTYRWRYLAEDYFDGFWARLVDRVGRNKALGGRFPFLVSLGKTAYRVGDRVQIGVRFTEAAAVAEASGLAAEVEPDGQAPEPLVFERVPDDPASLTASFPAERAGGYTLRITPATGADAGATTRVSTTNFRVEPPRRELDEPSLNRALLADLARLTGGRVLDVSEAGKLDESIAMREVTRTVEQRDELWDAPILYATIILGLTAEWISRKIFRMV